MALRLGLGAQSSLDTAVPLSELRRDVQSRYPDYQFTEPVVIPKPRSLGSLSPSLHSWFDLHTIQHTGGLG